MKEVVQENFTRYADDQSMNKHLKEQINEDDPMAQYFLTKRQKIEIKTGTGKLLKINSMLIVYSFFLFYVV